MKPLCVAAYVYGDYKRFIPLYIYSILKSYPDYFVKIFVRDYLSNKERKALKLLKENLSGNFEIREGYLANITLTTNTTIVGGAEKALRFLIPYEEFKHFKNVYIGDADFLIIKEVPELLVGHLKHCEQIGLPYSNLIRDKSQRLTGLHFFQVEQYYNKMNHIINYYLSNVDCLLKTLKSLKRDEEFLYKIVQKGIGFGEIKDYHYRPPHGFHLGVLRSEKLEKATSRYEKYINQKQLLRQGIKDQIRYYMNDGLFKEMLKIVPNNEITTLSTLIQK